MMEIAVLGGYGNAGRAIVKLLAAETKATIIVAGRNREDLDAFVQNARAQFTTASIHARVVDAEDENEIAVLFESADLCVNASSTTRLTGKLLNLAIKQKCDYMDIQYSAEKVQILLEQKERIREAGITVITDAGYHPGLPSAMARIWTSRDLDPNSIMIDCYLGIDWRAIDVSKSTRQEFVAEMMSFNSEIYRAGKWRKGRIWSGKDMRKTDFGEHAGRRTVIPLAFEELRDIPGLMPDLDHMGFYITGFNTITDYVVGPLCMLMMKLGGSRIRNVGANLFFWSLQRFSRPPFTIIMQSDCVTEGNEKYRLRLSHEDGYFLTAAPVVATILQYLDQQSPRPGVHFMGQYVEPERLFSDMARMGIQVEFSGPLSA